jgi:hypothetical protein
VVFGAGAIGRFKPSAQSREEHFAFRILLDALCELVELPDPKKRVELAELRKEVAFVSAEYAHVADESLRNAETNWYGPPPLPLRGT